MKSLSRKRKRIHLECFSAWSRETERVVIRMEQGREEEEEEEKRIWTSPTCGSLFQVSSKSKQGRC